MAAIPSPLNYVIGKGVLKWLAQGDVAGTYRDLGNAPEFELTPAVERKEHYSSRMGIRFKDLSVNSQVQLTVRFILEEWTADNLALFFMGDLTPPGTDLYSVVTIFTETTVFGALRFIGANEVGDKIQVDLPNVNLAPQAAVQMIADDWGRLELQGDVMGDPTTGSFGTILSPITTEITSPPSARSWTTTGSGLVVPEPVQIQAAEREL